jgi:ATP-binding cassette, subfamily B, multidrug efflux pump
MSRDSKKPGAARSDHDEEKIFAGRAYDFHLLARIWQFVRAHRILLFAAMATLPIEGALKAAPPAILKRVIDGPIAAHDPQGVLAMAMAYGAAVIGQFLVTYLQSILLLVCGARTTADMRRSAFEKLQRLPMPFFDRTPIGRLITRLTSDLEAIGDLFASGLVASMSNLVTFIAIATAMFALNWKLALVALGMVPFLVAAVGWMRTGYRHAWQEIRVRVARLNAFLQEALSGIATLQLYDRGEGASSDFQQLNARYRDANFSAIRYDTAISAVVELAASISIAAVLYYGAGVTAGGAVSFGVLVAFVEYVQRLFGPVRDLVTQYSVAQAATASAERFFAMLDEPEPPKRSNEPLAHFSQRIEAVDVTFAYGASLSAAGTTNGSRPALDRMSLCVRRGERVAIVGQTGGGKSTLAKLIARLYDLPPGDGKLSIDGIEVGDLDETSLRRLVLLVPQEPFLFRGTIADNISLGQASRASVEEAVRRLGASAIVARLPKGLDTPVEDRGTNLSSGERQLVAFARAMVRAPEILVLDEATSAVDPATEAVVIEATTRLLEGRTAIVIAHRLSTVEVADRVVVVHQGRVVEEGTHGSLLAREGVYARLHRLQSEAG